MQITKIEKTGRKCRIYLNDEPSFDLYPSEISEYELTEGMELTDSRRDAIYSAVLSGRAKLRCMHILQGYDRTEKQLRDRLREDGYPQSVTDEAIEYVKSYHYLDDRRYACQYVHGRQQKKSRGQIRAELTARGVSGDDIEYALLEEYENSDEEAIRYWMEKKHFIPEQADEQQRMKMMQFLCRKGFPYGEVKKLLT